jgi:hypothetical protein
MQLITVPPAELRNVKITVDGGRGMSDIISAAISSKLPGPYALKRQLRVSEMGRQSTSLQSI